MATTANTANTDSSKKILFCDLDGTLINHLGEIDEYTLTRIRQFCDAGNEFIIATGRQYDDITHFERRIDRGGNYRVSQNGAVILDAEGNTLQDIRIDDDVTVALYNHLEGLSNERTVALDDPSYIRLEFTNDANRYIITTRPELTGYLGGDIGRTPIFEDVNGFANRIQSIRPVKYVIFKSTPEFSAEKEGIESLFPGKFYYPMTSPNTVEVVPLASTKGAGLKFVAKHANFNLDNCYAVGDNGNDIPMFQAVKVSFAMDNASDDVKEHATHIVATVGEAIDKIMGA